MHGRLTVEKVNLAVEEIHQILTEKYKLLAKSTSKLNESSNKKYKQYKDQETKDTKGLYFFTEHDLKNTNYLKVDATGKSILTLLIQLGRLKVNLVY